WLPDGRVETLEAAPIAEQLGSPRDPETVSEVEGEDDLEAGQQLLLDEAAEVDQRATDRNPVMDIAGEDELALGRAFVGESDISGPGRRLGRKRHQLFSATPSAAGGVAALPMAREAGGAAWPPVSRAMPSFAAKSASAWS